MRHRACADESLAGISDPDSGGTGAAYRQLPFVEHMELAYAAADFVLCRSGAMTCAELSAVGLPALYVPLPLRGGEQHLNAEAIVRAGGGLLVSDEQLSVEWISRTLLPCLLDPARRAGMSAAALRMARPDADVVIARHWLAVARNRRPVPDVKLDSE
ncbi:MULTISPECIES: UDP-N-acetylglucosamine--N-acetylmuramyl-(pentapeptide) pyrophosphoryl-undecaprenol N-acetylglucosamine transferase [Arthrobacter]|uniref:UDP-N-acetylglucosamine--N-acetylmuramyl- (pentapeptide) pyrophosphoryl-undecaprenol N-acetylglucosamine transferase n=1 Tax=Arthrobacter TaxID=1663 RepID=UPI0021570B6D|nr:MULTISPECIES: glycosyltransferase [Arthrobacter]